MEKTKAVIIAMNKGTHTIINDVCDDFMNAKKSVSAGDTLFAGQVVTHGGFTAESYPAFDASEWDAGGRDRSVIMYGCIDYQFPDRPGHHQSRFAFFVGKAIDQDGLERVGNLPPDPTTVDIRLMPVNIGKERAPN